MNSGELKRILAVDFGLKRIGLALTDPLKTFAYPFKTITNNPGTLSELEKIISEQEVEKIVLGYPLKESGEDSSITKEVLKFKSLLEKKFNMEIILIDERYSSLIAMEHIRQTVTKKSKRREKGLVDQSAAAVILQDYLNEIKP